MSQKESVPTKGSKDNVGNDVFTRELFDSITSTSSSNGSCTSTSNNITTTSTEGSACSSSSLECSSTSDLQGSGLSSPYAQYNCQLEPPSKLSPPLKLHSTHSKPSSTSPSALSYPRKVEHAHNGAVKRSMGLMKLRRQGSHPPPPACKSSNTSSCHGSFNQAAAARELMASLERLSMKEKSMGTHEEREREAQSWALLAGEREEIVESSKNGRKAELPLTAKIAAAMDAEGLIGVQEEISLQSTVLRSFSDRYNLPSSFKTRKPRPAASVDHEMRSVALRKMHSKRRNRWIIRRRLCSSRALLGKIWRKVKRFFSSSSRKHLQKDPLKIRT